MAINWSTIEGFREDMTAEERLNLIEAQENYVFVDPSVPKITKAQFDKVSSELAATKKQLKEKMSEDEQKEAERLAADQALRDELAELRKKDTLSQYKTALMAQGYDEKSAANFANSLIDGNMDEMFKTMKAVQGEIEKRMRSEILKNTPTPLAGGYETKDEDNDGVKIATQIGKAAASANKASADIISKYL